MISLHNHENVPFRSPMFLELIRSESRCQNTKCGCENNEHDRGHFSIICLQFLGLRKRFDKFWNLNYAAQIYQTWKDHKRLTKRVRALIFFFQWKLRFCTFQICNLGDRWGTWRQSIFGLKRYYENNFSRIYCYLWIK